MEDAVIIYFHFMIGCCFAFYIFSCSQRKIAFCSMSIWVPWKKQVWASILFIKFVLILEWAALPKILLHLPLVQDLAQSWTHRLSQKPVLRSCFNHLPAMDLAWIIYFPSWASMFHHLYTGVCLSLTLHGHLTGQKHIMQALRELSWTLYVYLTPFPPTAASY